MSKTKTYYDLLDILGTEADSWEKACPICHLALKSVSHYLDNLLYESVNDPGVRRDIRQARGFCNEHAWQLREFSEPLGIAIIHRDVVETVMALIEQGRCRRTQFLSLQRLQETLIRNQAATATTALAASLEPQGECPACRKQRIMEDIYLNTLLEHLDDEALDSGLRSSPGLCLPHFRRALELVSDEQTFHWLTDMQLAWLECLRGELSELIRKYDYRFFEEGFGPEGDAWIRAIAQVSGQKGVR